ncbi:hypothetical protein D3C78_1549580 [compost metagenome]
MANPGEHGAQMTAHSAGAKNSDFHERPLVIFSIKNTDGVQVKGSTANRGMIKID